MASLPQGAARYDEAAKRGARGLGVRNYENTVGLCTKGINCDSFNWPFGEPVLLSFFFFRFAFLLSLVLAFCVGSMPLVDIPP